MKPNTETEEEYVASRNLLLRYLNSDETLSALGGPIVQTILIFLRFHFFVHESHFVFYERTYTCLYEKYTNSCHEGTNYGIKYSGLGSRPNMGLDKSTERMTCHAVMGTKRHLQECGNSKVGYWSWTDIKCSMKLIKPAVEMFILQWNAGNLFDVCKISYNFFKVIYKYPEGRKKGMTLHFLYFAG